MKRALSVAKKETMHIVRSRGTFVLVVLSPLLLLMMMAYTFSIDIKGIPIGVMDNDNSSLSRSYISGLTASGDVELTSYASSYDEVEDLLLRGKIGAAVIIPPNFAEDIRQQTGAQIQVIGDGADPQTGMYALGHISAFTAAFAQEQMMSGIEEMQQPINLSIRAWYNPELRPAVGFVPGLIAVVMCLPAVAVASALVKEKEQGTMETLIATPLRRWELLLGKLVPYIAAGLLNVILATVVAILWFGVPLEGSFPLFLLLALIFFIACFGISSLISTFVSTQAVAIFFALLIFLFPSFFLSGLIFPVSAMSTMMQVQAYAFPATHLVTISRGIFLKGVGLEVLGFNVAILLIIAVVSMGLAFWRFRKKLA